MKKKVETARLYGFKKGIIIFYILQVLCVIGALSAVSTILTLHTWSHATSQTIGLIESVLTLCYCYGLITVRNYGYYMIQVRNTLMPFVAVIANLVICDIYNDFSLFDWGTVSGYTIGCILLFIYFKNRKILFWIYENGAVYDDFPYQLCENATAEASITQAPETPNEPPVVQQVIDEIVVDGIVYKRKKESNVKKFFVQSGTFLRKNWLTVVLSFISMLLLTISIILYVNNLDLQEDKYYLTAQMDKLESENAEIITELKTLSNALDSLQSKTSADARKVYTLPMGDQYHTLDCEVIQNKGNQQLVTLERQNVQALGLTPCPNCNP